MPLGSETFAFVRMAVAKHALSTRNISMASQTTSSKMKQNGNPSPDEPKKPTL
jgi:hypothetical protein